MVTNRKKEKTLPTIVFSDRSLVGLDLLKNQPDFIFFSRSHFESVAKLSFCSLQLKFLFPGD